MSTPADRSIVREQVRRESREALVGQCVYVVGLYGGWDKDDYLFAYLQLREAEEHCERLNGEPYDPENLQDYRVFPIPLR